MKSGSMHSSLESQYPLPLCSIIIYLNRAVSTTWRSWKICSILYRLEVPKSWGTALLPSWLTVVCGASLQLYTGNRSSSLNLYTEMRENAKSNSCIVSIVQQLHPAAASINVSKAVWDMYFNALLSSFTTKGDDGNYGLIVSIRSSMLAGTNLSD